MRNRPVVAPLYFPSVDGAHDVRIIRMVPKTKQVGEATVRALLDGPLDAEQIVRKSLDIAAEICVFTNRNVTVETLKS